MTAIFTAIESSTVFDQDPHDFPDHCTVIPTRTAPGEFLAGSDCQGACGRFRIGRSKEGRSPVLLVFGIRGAAPAARKKQ
ncbi:hypothetical protein ACF09J_05585 [Streptomyces sp. NPDC014889]|uniref:hypothetical protein n=1 Tax=Streptomyces sp. NPDC014889 TaxID=3364928 RepID=UPI0037019B3A